MTRLWVISDLHLDHVGNRAIDLTPPGDAEIAIVAGDIGGMLHNAVAVVARITAGLPTIIVAGNHDYYADGPSPRPTMAQILDRARDAASRHAHMHILECDAVVIEGVRFLGTTLWTDGWTAARDRLWSPRAAFAEIEKGMNDYRKIRTGPTTRHRLRLRDTRGIHERSVAWLRSAMAETSDEPTVVVTHHGPDPGSGSDGEMASAYWSDLRELIAEGRPDVWVHGHTHKFRDDVVSETRMVSNPLGYPRERTGFDVDLLIKVSGLRWRGPR
jgi:predicted phosphodiesterase